MENKNFSEFAIVSLVIGVLSFVQLLAIEKAFAAIIFGIIALSRIAKKPESKGKGLAVSGVALGLIYILVLSIIVGLNPGIFTRIQAVLSSQ